MRSPSALLVCLMFLTVAPGAGGAQTDPAGGLRALDRHGHEAFQQEYYRDAEAAFAQAADLATRLSPGANGLLPAASYKKLAAIAHASLLIQDMPMERREQPLRKSYADLTALLGGDHLDSLVVLMNVADHLTWQGNGKSYGPPELKRDTEAESLYRQVYEVRARVLGPEDRRTLMARTSRDGAAYRVAMDKGGDLAPVVQQLRETYEIERRLFGDREGLSASAMTLLSTALSSQGKIADSILLRDNAVLSGSEMRRGAYTAAEEARRLEYDRVVARYGAGSPLALGELLGLAQAVLAQGRFSEAEEQLRRYYEGEMKRGEAFAREQQIALILLGQALLGEGEYGEAETLLQKVRDEEKRFDTSDENLMAEALLARAVQAQGRPAEAEQLLMHVYRHRILPEDRGAAAADLARFYLDAGRNGEAEILYREADALMPQGGVAGWATVSELHGELALMLAARGLYRSAEPQLAGAVGELRKSVGDTNPATIALLAKLGILRSAELGRHAQGYADVKNAVDAFWARAGDSHVAGSQDSSRRMLADTRWIFEGQMDAAWRWAQEKPGAPTRESRDADFWKTVSATNDPVRLAGYLKAYPDGAFAAQAAQKIKAMRLRDCDRCGEMAIIPPGAFVMGGRDTVHRGEDVPLPRLVQMDYAFAVSDHDVTFAEWDACVAAGGCEGYRPWDNNWGRGDRPVINVSWQDAQSYLQWLRKVTGKNYRLLTEAEWEYAARAGSNASYWWGDDAGAGCRNANLADRSIVAAESVPFQHANCDDTYPHTSPVGAFPANGFGLFDMLGNVAQWTSDCAEPPARPGVAAIPGKQADSCAERVIRGTSWMDFVGNYQLSTRASGPDSVRQFHVGFRVARYL